jgi:hypothetical protein
MLWEIKTGEFKPMKYKKILKVALTIWLGTFIFLIPYRIQPPHGASLLGLLCGMYLPISWAAETKISWILDNSYWIGVLITLLVSGVVILMAGPTKREARMVILIDLAIIALSFLVGYLSAIP